MSTAYFGYDALLLSKMAKVIGKYEDAETYAHLHQSISSAFTKAFVDEETGIIHGDTQSVYIFALYFELLPEDLRVKAANNLRNAVERQNWHLTTGFYGNGLLNNVLSDYGMSDVAYQLILQETYPSWIYPILHNATTIWERWDGWTEDGGFQTPAMNSFNHYALGSVGHWMYEYVGGINVDMEMGGAGFRNIMIKPQLSESIGYASASYDSIQGLIESKWKSDGNKEFTLDVTIPVNTKAKVLLPNLDGTYSTHSIGSGIYNFKVQL